MGDLLSPPGEQDGGMGVIVFNLAWTVDSAVVLAAGWFPLTALGVAFVLAQAAAVAIIAAAQFYALKRAYPVRPA